MIKLYDYALSGNCFKVRVLLKWLGLEHELVPIDFYPGLEFNSDEFKAINPLGQLPVIDDDGEIVVDSAVILKHLATKYGADTKWYPPSKAEEIENWFKFADRITDTISAARLHDAMFFELDVDKARAGGVQALREIDDHLWFAENTGQDWLVEGEAPTLADIACFPYIAIAEEAGLDTAPYGAIHRWIERFMRIDGFEPMAGMMPLAMPK